MGSESDGTDEEDQTSITFVTSVGQNKPFHRFALELGHKPLPGDSRKNVHIASLLTNQPPDREQLKEWIGHVLPIQWLRDQIVGRFMLRFGEASEDDPSYVVVKSGDMQLHFSLDDFFNDGNHVVKFTCLQKEADGLFAKRGRARFNVDIKKSTEVLAEMIYQTWPMPRATAVELAKEVYHVVLRAAIPE